MKGKIDYPLIGLIKKMNKVGIKTIGCCSGHNKKPAFISIDMKSLYQIKVVDYKKYGKKKTVLFIEFNLKKVK